MESDSVFKDWQNQYCENEHSPKAIYKHNAFPIKYPCDVFKRNRKKFIKLMYAHIRSWIPKAVMSEKKIASPYFKTYYRAIAIKSMVAALKQTYKLID